MIRAIWRRLKTPTAMLLLLLVLLMAPPPPAPTPAGGAVRLTTGGVWRFCGRSATLLASPSIMTCQRPLVASCETTRAFLPLRSLRCKSPATM